MKQKIFLAAPFQHYMDYQKGGMRKDRVHQIRVLVAHLRNKGYEVYSAHEREKWGGDWYSPEICTPLDFRQIASSDLLIAIPGNPPSGGVHIELGWASALNKRAIILIREGETYSNLLLGLGELIFVKFVHYRIFSEIPVKLDEILG